MRSRSTTAGAEEEFSIAVAAGDRRGEHLDVLASERGREGFDVVTDLGVDGGVANDAALGMLSVKPPVEAPTSRQTWPSMSIGYRSSAPASLTPPLET